MVASQISKYLPNTFVPSQTLKSLIVDKVQKCVANYEADCTYLVSVRCERESRLYRAQSIIFIVLANCQFQ